MTVLEILVHLSNIHQPTAARNLHDQPVLVYLAALSSEIQTESPQGCHGLVDASMDPPRVQLLGIDGLRGQEKPARCRRG